MTQRARTQTDTFVMRTGSRAFRLGGANLRRNWWAAIGTIAGSTAYNYSATKSWPETFTQLGLVLAGLAVGLVLWFALCSLSTVELTRAELVVTHLGRRRRLPRTEVGEVVRAVHTPGSSPSDACYWFITDTQGERFVMLPGWHFPRRGFEDLAHALGGVSRDTRDRQEETRLSPWWLKNLAVTAVVVAVPTLAVAVLATWGGSALHEWWQERVEQSAVDDYVARVEPHLTTSRYPHLTTSRHGAPTSPLHASSSAADSSEPTVWSTIDLEGPDTEMPAAETMDLLDLQCDPPGNGADVTRASVTYASDDDLGYERVIVLECGADRDVVREWLDWAEEHPAPADIGDLTLESTIGYDGEPGREAQMLVPAASDDSFREAVEYMCAHPGADEVDLGVYDEDLTRSLDHVDCSDIEGELAG